MKQQQDVQSRARAERVYTQFLRLYPRAHQQAFGEPMLQAFRDHYGDAIETEGEHTARFWLRVVGDEGQSLLREHMAAFAERIWFMKLLLIAPTLELWRRRQTRGLALAIQLCLIAAVLLVWTPLLVARVLLVTSQLGLGLVQSNSGSVSYYLSAAVERPTNQFVSAFMQASANIEASDLHTYHFSSSRVEISTLALARAAVGAAAPTPAFLLDGEEASRLTTDLRVVEGRLPAPAVGVLEVVVTKASADQLHLVLGAALPITALAGEPPPLVRAIRRAKPSDGLLRFTTIPGLLVLLGMLLMIGGLLLWAGTVLFFLPSVFPQILALLTLPYHSWLLQFIGMLIALVVMLRALFPRSHARTEALPKDVSPSDVAASRELRYYPVDGNKE